MSRNYNTTLSKPYVRVQQIVIKYGTSEDQRADISINEGAAIVDADGLINAIHGSLGSIEKVVSLSEIESESFSLINPATGEALGTTMSLQDLYVAIASYIRSIQQEVYPQ